MGGERGGLSITSLRQILFALSQATPLLGHMPAKCPIAKSVGLKIPIGDEVACWGGGISIFTYLLLSVPPTHTHTHSIACSMWSICMAAFMSRMVRDRMGN